MFDDSYWVVRSLVADTGFWPKHRVVLLTPSAFKEINEAVSVLFLNGTRTALVSHELEESAQDRAWTSVLNNAQGTDPARHEKMESLNRATVETIINGIGATAREHGNQHLCSWREVVGCRIQAENSDLGYVSDVIIEDRSWTILYFVLSIGRWWWARKNLLVLPDWIEYLNWDKHWMRVKVAPQLICDAPQFHASLLWSYEYEQELFDLYYNQTV